MATLDALMKETADVMGAEPLSVAAENVNCAETDGSKFYYNPSFMGEIEAAGGEDGVRFVLAHEMGHQVGGMECDGHAGEFMADEFATRALAQMGCDFSSIQGVFSKLGTMNDQSSATHPAPGSRASRAQGIYRDAAELADADEVGMGDTRRSKNANVKDLAL